jgi:hypothetical protein
MISEEKEKEKEKDDDETDEIKDVNANLKEEYLRNRFRSYMDSFRLYTKDGKKISLKIEVQNKKISILPITSQ